MIPRTHKRHLITCLQGKYLGCLLWVFWKTKWTCYIYTVYCFSLLHTFLDPDPYQSRGQSICHGHYAADSFMSLWAIWPVSLKLTGYFQAGISWSQNEESMAADINCIAVYPMYLRCFQSTLLAMQHHSDGVWYLWSLTLSYMFYFCTMLFKGWY